MTQVTIHEAKAQLSKLIRRALEGEEIIIAKGKSPLVKLTVLPEAHKERRLGGARGVVTYIYCARAPLIFRAWRRGVLQYAPTSNQALRL